jgi:hypothetical protein
MNDRPDFVRRHVAVLAISKTNRVGHSRIAKMSACGTNPAFTAA